MDCGSTPSTSASMTRNCATTRRGRSICARRAASAPRIPTASNGTGTTTAQPEMLPFLEEIRGLLDEFPDVVALGEISSDDSTATVAEYTQPGRLHMAYSFELLSNDSSPTHIRNTVENLIAACAAELAVLDDLQSRRGARGQPLGPQHFLAAHGDSARRHWSPPCAVQCAYSRARSSGSRKRTCLTRRCVILMASRSGPHSRAATAVARPCPGMRASERASRTWRPGCRYRISTCICRWRRRSAIPPLPCTAFAACSSGASRFRC